MKEKALIVREEEAGVRLDVLIQGRYPAWTLEAVAEAIRGGQVRIDKARLVPETVLEVGQKFWVAAPHLAPTSPLPPCPPIVHQDAETIAFSKPPNLLCHPVGSTFVWGLINIARERFPGEDLHLAHRLDKETSGVVVMARCPETNRRLKAAFKARRVVKRYLAIVRGEVDFQKRRVDLPIGRDPLSPIRMKMGIVADGQEARTEFVVKERLPGLTLLECRPLSGRTHQIRVHLEAIGHPLLGDKIYGQPPEVFLSIWEKRPLPDLDERLGHPRHCLHASEILFDLEDGVRKYAAPLAGDMQDLLKQTRS